MIVARVIALAIVALIAAVVVIQSTQVQVPSSFAGTVSVETSDFSTNIETALSSYELNAENTENVYQQQVVALWATKDLLEVTARQNATIIENQVGLARAIESANNAAAESSAASVQLSKTIVLMMGLLLVAVAIIGFTLLPKTSTNRGEPAAALPEPEPPFSAAPQG